MTLDFKKATWLNKPQSFSITPDLVSLTTEAETDFWQRSYYGFRNDNAPALLLESDASFSFTTKVSFEYQTKFDQAGVIIYLDSNNWFKASVEFEDAAFSRLGSVVTNFGYSDWASTDIASLSSIWYRLNRRGPDFLIEASYDGITFKQMRIFHLHSLGSTSEAMGKLKQVASNKTISFGLYACSPLESSFTASFSHFSLEDCLWLAHN